MTPKDKAEFLVNRFNIILQNKELSTRCAIIAVMEIINEKTDHEEDTAYYQEVINEIYYINIGKHEAKADKFNLDA
jgi:hypothetical protein